MLPTDLPDGGLTKCDNLLPFDFHYIPARDLVLVTSTPAGAEVAAITDTPISSHIVYDSSGVAHEFIGSSTKIWKKKSDGVFEDYSKGGGYSTGSNIWDYAQYGNWLVATNYVDQPQILKTLDTKPFADVGGTPPKARYVLFYNGHLIFAYTNDGTVEPKKLTWSAFESIEDYTPSLSTGADSQNLADIDGHITGLGIVGSSFAIFHENGVSLGWYSGAPYTLSFRQNVVTGYGCTAPGSIASIGDGIYYWGKKHILFFDGQTSKPVGEGVERRILDNLDLNNVHRVTNKIDFKNNLIYWSYPSTDSDGTPDKILVFNYRTRVYTLLDIGAHSTLHYSKPSAFDMDSMDTAYPSMDDIGIDMDSAFWLGGEEQLGVIKDSDKKYYTFSGAALTGVIETKEYGVDDKVIHVSRVRPIVQEATEAVSTRVKYRFDPNDGGTYSGSSTMGSNQYCDIRQSGKFIGFEVTTGDHLGFSHIKVDMVESRGRR